jgi:hypothetical protein
MPASVQQQMPGTLGYTAITTSSPVRGVTWVPVADATNYLLSGPCRQIIPQGGGFGALSEGVTSTLRWRIWPSVQATHRVWCVGISGAAEDEAGPQRVAFVDPSSGTASFTCPAFFNWKLQQFQHVETIGARTSSETAISVTLTPAVGDGIITSISCFEVSRPDLAIDTSDRGLESYSFGGANPIYDGVGYSLGALPESLAAALAMRRTLHQWAVPSADAATFNTGSEVALFSYSPPLLDRQIYRNETQVEITVWVYTRSDATTTGHVTCTMTSGDTCTIAITANDTGTWRSGLISIDAENLAASDGRRSTRWDQCVITGMRDSGAGALYVDSVSISGRAG